jgi:predicted ATPase
VKTTHPFAQYIKEVQISSPTNPEHTDIYPFNIPLLKNLKRIKFTTNVTFLVGENGTGKSTLLEAIAEAYGFNPEGGSKNFAFSTFDQNNHLANSVQIAKGAIRPKDGFFLLAESFFNVASNIENMDHDKDNGKGGPSIIGAYGGKSLHEQSHGESFLALLVHRFKGRGLYLLDEPEAALSPMRQLAMIGRIHQLVALDSQFIIATHSPILLAYPGAVIYQFSDSGITRVDYEDTEHYQVARGFLENPQGVLDKLFSGI